jgi:predicted ABC-type ATPase
VWIRPTRSAGCRIFKNLDNWTAYTGNGSEQFAVAGLDLNERFARYHILLARPNLIVLAGPNGAGKTTASRNLLTGALAVEEFVNADAIAKGLSAFRPESVAIEAGRIMLARLHELAADRVSFAFETTLASRSFAPWIQKLRENGYAFRLIYLWLHSADHAVTRVRERVSSGGHDVPEAVIRRRYQGGLKNFFQLYSPLAEGWTFFDSSVRGRAALIAEGSYAVTTLVSAPELWDNLRREWS